MSGLEFRGPHLDFLNDATPEIDLEGSLSCGKTTVCLCKELRMLKKYPGMHSFIGRWTDDATNTLLRPALEQMARIEGMTLTWNEKLKYYETDGNCRIYSFGLKTQSQDPVQRYGKIRGLAVSRIYVDQAEQLPADIALELRARLRPDLEARLGGFDYPRQLTFSPNPTRDDPSEWLVKQFPAKNSIKGRKYYALSLFDNQHNLSPEMIAGLLQAYPPEHPKHTTVILGQRGMNVTGDPVYEMIFDRAVHVRALQARDDQPILEGFEFGLHNPVWLAAQRSFHGGIALLGGVMGKRMMLEDFFPMVQRYRAEWFPDHLTEFKTCTSPMAPSSGFTLVTMLSAAGYRAQWRDDGNAHDVQLAMIEHIAGDLRRRTVAREEAVGITNDASRWIVIDAEGSVRQSPFLAFAFEGGYVWDPNDVSQGNKRLRQPHVDGEYSNAMKCLEQIVLNFCAGMPTDHDRREREKRQQLDAAYLGPSVAMGPQGWLVS